MYAFSISLALYNRVERQYGTNIVKIHKQQSLLHYTYTSYTKLQFIF